MRQQNLVGGTAEVTQHVISLVVQQDVFDLVRGTDRGLGLQCKEKNMKSHSVFMCSDRCS